MDDKFNLFNNDGSTPIVPKLDQGLDEGTISDSELREQLKSGEKLLSGGLDKVIRGEVVKTLMLAEESGVALPNYVIDITNVDRMLNYHSRALDALLNEDGDAVIYAYTAAGLVKLGRGLTYTLDRVIASSVDSLLSSRARVYKDFQPGKPLRELTGKSVETLRLKI